MSGGFKGNLTRRTLNVHVQYSTIPTIHLKKNKELERALQSAAKHSYLLRSFSPWAWRTAASPWSWSQRFLMASVGLADQLGGRRTAGGISVDSDRLMTSCMCCHWTTEMSESQSTEGPATPRRTMYLCQQPLVLLPRRHRHSCTERQQREQRRADHCCVCVCRSHWSGVFMVPRCEWFMWKHRRLTTSCSLCWECAGAAAVAWLHSFELLWWHHCPNGHHWDFLSAEFDAYQAEIRHQRKTEFEFRSLESILSKRRLVTVNSVEALFITSLSHSSD